MIHGHFDAIRGRDVSGWIWDDQQPTTPVTVSVYINNQRVCEADATDYRTDLHALGMGQGLHGFHVQLPDAWLRGQSVLFEVRGPDNRPLAPTPVNLVLPNLVFSPVPPPDHTLPLELAVCAIVRDELPYMLEWIAWHRLIGVQRFVLFDNSSTDGTTELLSALARTGIVDHVIWPNIDGVAAQLPAYIAGLARLANRCRWVAFIDADEFINPLRGESLTDILQDYETAAGLVLPWRLFGSSGHVEHESGLVISRFTNRAHADHVLNNFVKTIAQSRFIARVGVHTPMLHQGSLVDEAGTLPGSSGHPDFHAVPQASRLVLNHYFTKSRAEWQRKRMRGMASEVVGSMGWRRPDDHFRSHDLNDVEDLTMAQRSDAVQAEIAHLQSLL
jgi:hypothetical protein